MTSEEVFSTLCELIAEQFGVDPEEITMKTSFFDDLGADSVDLVELVMSMEEEFDVGEIEDEQLEKIATVGDAVDLIVARHE